MGYVVVDGRSSRDVGYLFDNASTARHVSAFGPDLENLPPELPAAAYVAIGGSSKITAIPAMPAAKHVSISECPAVTSLPEFTAAVMVFITEMHGLAELPAMPSASCVYIEDCSGLVLSAGTSRNGNQFALAPIRGHWRITAGFKCFSIAEARSRWGADSSNPVKKPDSDNEALAMTEILAAKLAVLHPDADQSVVTDPFLVYPIEKAAFAVVDAVKAWRSLKALF